MLLLCHDGVKILRLKICMSYGGIKSAQGKHAKCIWLGGSYMSFWWLEYSFLSVLTGSDLLFFLKTIVSVSLYCQRSTILRASGKIGPALRKSSLLMCEIANLVWCFRVPFLWEVAEYPVFVSIFKSVYPMHLIIFTDIWPPSCWYIS